MSKHTVTIELNVKHTYEIDLEDESYEFANNELEDALQQDVANTFDEPVEWLANLEQCDIKVIGWDRSVRGVDFGNNVIELEDKQQDGEPTT